MKHLTGVPASPGIAIGRAFLFIEDDLPEIIMRPVLKAGLEDELNRFEAALCAASLELKLLTEKASPEMGREENGIFTAQLMMLEDPDFIDQITDRIKTKLECAEWALWKTAGNLAEKLAASENSMFRERAVDISDVSKRVLYKLFSINNRFSLADLAEDVILVARDILPSDMLTMNRARVKGIAMDMGSGTSHAAILSRAFNIPAVLGLSSASKEIKDKDELVLDGSTGEVFVKPVKKVLENYRKTETLNRNKHDEAARDRELPAETKDGRRVLLKANIGVPEEAERLIQLGADGIGLYRSEFLFMVPGRTAGEDVQFDAYSRVLKAMGKLPVTIRTVDLGGDKLSPEFQGQADRNPLLGWRGIRFSLSRPEIFKEQLRAILRAGVNGNARIMFPLVSGVEELEAALALLEEAKKECRKKGRPIVNKIEAGTMIEVPSAAVTADIIAEKSAFFSIGTNDLVQYSIAADRGNERVNYLARPEHPALIRLIKTTIDAAHKRGIKAAMCGEMAGNPLYTPLLLGLGLDEFSMSVQAIPGVKKVIRALSLEECKTLAGKILDSSSVEKNLDLLKSWMKEKFPS